MDAKSAWLVGSGLASLSAAAFLIRDGRCPATTSTFWRRPLFRAGLRRTAHPSSWDLSSGGGREMENHYECLWDRVLLHPLWVENASVLDEFLLAEQRRTPFTLSKKPPATPAPG